MEAKSTKTADTTHECPGYECKARVPRRQLMCGRCWRLVPGPLQRALYAAYDRGRGLGSAAHLQAVHDCIDAVTP